MPPPVGASLPAQILALLADGTPRTSEQLAQSLGVSIERLRYAVQTLRTRGEVRIADYRSDEEAGWGRARPALWVRTRPPAP